MGIRAVYLLTTTAERFFPRFGFEVIDRADVPDSVMRSAEIHPAPARLPQSSCGRL